MSAALSSRFHSLWGPTSGGQPPLWPPPPRPCRPLLASSVSAPPCGSALGAFGSPPARLRAPTRTRGSRSWRFPRPAWAAARPPWTPGPSVDTEQTSSRAFPKHELDPDPSPAGPTRCAVTTSRPRSRLHRKRSAPAQCLGPECTALARQPAGRVGSPLSPWPCGCRAGKAPELRARGFQGAPSAAWRGSAGCSPTSPTSRAPPQASLPGTSPHGKASRNHTVDRSKLDSSRGASEEKEETSLA